MTNVIVWGNPALSYLDFSKSFTAENKDLTDQGIRASKDGEFEIHADGGHVLRFTHYRDKPNGHGGTFSSEYEVVMDNQTPAGIDRKLSLMIYYTK